MMVLQGENFYYEVLHLLMINDGKKKPH